MIASYNVAFDYYYFFLLLIKLSSFVQLYYIVINKIICFIIAHLLVAGMYKRSSLQLENSLRILLRNYKMFQYALVCAVLAVATGK